ncbi:MAG: 3-methyl-2-oxobutanoate hydroxymethyltransferase [Candidatus Thorarchaeota archaeon]
MSKITSFDILRMKKEGKKISVLTAYDTNLATILDEAKIDIILIGDSMGTVVYGAPNTLEVTLNMVINHTKAVSRGAKNYSMIVADMPFMSFGLTVEETVNNAGLLVKEGGAEAVKLEGASAKRIKEIESIIDIGIPVQGHIGLIPQSTYRLGGYKVQGKEESFFTEEQLLVAAQKLEEAGCFSLILEAIPYDVAEKITNEISIPTIGIGAGPYCDGQVLVTYDMLGYALGHRPKFVKTYINLHDIISEAVKSYSKEVKDGSYPTLDYSYKR